MKIGNFRERFSGRQPAAPTPVTQMPGGKPLPPGMGLGMTPDVIPRPIPLPAPTGPMPMPRTLPPAPTGPMTGAPPPMIQKGIGMKKGGKVKVSSASKRADGVATKGKTKGRMV